MPYTILIAEDEQSLRKVLTDKLSAFGYTILQAKDGEEALRIFTSEHIDFVLLDILMPKRNGLDVLREIRNTEKQPTSVIILSNSNQPDSVAQAKKLGALAYIIKSDISLREMTELIVSHLPQHS